MRSISYFASVAILIASQLCLAATIHVPADQPTIQAASNVSVEGDSILVSPGVYTENISFNSAIHLISLEVPASTTIVSANPGQSIIKCDISARSSYFTLSGFTIRGARNTQFSVLVRYCYFKATNNWITDNLSSSNFVFDANQGEISGNVIWGCTGTFSGIWCNMSQSGIIANNIIHDNVNSLCGGIKVDVGAGTNSQIIFNVVYNIQNTSPDFASAINIDGHWQVRNNTIVMNSGPSAAVWVGNPYVDVRNNVIAYNACSGLKGSSPQDYNNVFANTTGNYVGTAPGLHDIGSDPQFVNGSSNDFRLGADSPCINAGDPNPTYNDPDGTRNDIGAIPFGVLNHPPTISPLRDTTLLEGDTLIYNITASDPDSTTPTLVAQNLPSGATFNLIGPGAAGIFNWHIGAKQYGTFHPKFIAADSALADTVIANITVNPRPPQVGTIDFVDTPDPSHVVLNTPTIQWTYLDFGNDDPQTQFEFAVGSDSDWTFSEMWNPAPFNSSNNYIIYNGSPLIDGTAYWLRLRVTNTLGASPWKQASFRMNSHPSIPAQRLPLNNALVPSLTPTFTIHNSTDAENDTLNYLFEVSADSNFNVTYSFAKTQDIDSLTTCTIDSTLHENAKYYWRVKASDYFEESAYSSARAFFVNAANTAPTVFSLSVPANTLTPAVNTKTPTFIWTAATDPDPADSVKYTLYVANDSNFTFTSQVPGLTATSFTPATNLAWGTRYWWRVKASDLNGGATFSGLTYTFRTVTIGDADGNGFVNISDAVFLINYIFTGGSAPNPLFSADANCDNNVNISDAVFLIQYIFAGGTPPCSP